MGLPYTKTIDGVEYACASQVEYCYVRSLSVGVNTKLKSLTCHIVFELKDSTKKLIAIVDGKVDKTYDTLPKVSDIMDFITTEVKAFIKQKKQDYSGYVEP